MLADEPEEQWQQVGCAIEAKPKNEAEETGDGEAAIPEATEVHEGCGTREILLNGGDKSAEAEHEQHIYTCALPVALRRFFEQQFEAGEEDRRQHNGDVV